jgi:hypothetical protein
LGESITIETDLFEHREVKAHFINPCCFGEDFAAWLRQELLHLDRSFQLSEPVQEDYGWGFHVSHGKTRLWVALSYVGSGPQEAPAQFVISVVRESGFESVKRVLGSPDPPELAELRDLIRQIVMANPAIKTINP